MTSTKMDSIALARAAAQRGLYRPQMEHDACGIGFVAHINGAKSHAIVTQALEALDRLTHRGGCGCDPDTGDGAGILVQIPHLFFAKESKKLGFELPHAAEYAVGMFFLPRDAAARKACMKVFDRVAVEEDQSVLGWREVPIREEHCGSLARESLPSIWQVFLAVDEDDISDTMEMERKLFVIRKRVEREVRERKLAGEGSFYVCSLSSRTIVYKGLLQAAQIPLFYPDLQDSDFMTAMALFHSRFSTNTFPSWERAHPNRYTVHNGEINTVRGNVNWMRAREGMFESPGFGDDMSKIFPIIDPEASDSGMFDNAFEALLQTGRSLPHAMMMMIPEAWQSHTLMDEERRAFYEYHACLMEPWDGPASMAFTDGNLIGAVLDRNGLRPSRYVVTKDDMVVMASEAGVIEVPPENVAFKNRLEPGRMFLVDTDRGRIIEDAEIKEEMAERKPYGRWLAQNMRFLGELPAPASESIATLYDPESLLMRQHAHGYTREDVNLLIRTMAVNGKEGTGSMGNDTPPAVLSNRPQTLFSYFRQLFAQVTNPPIDPLREELVMSLQTTLGSEQNLFEESPRHCRQLTIEQPILRNAELAKLKELDEPGFKSHTLPILFEVSGRGAGLEKAVEQLCEQAEKAVDEGVTVLVLSDRGHDAERAPIPSLLAVAAVHHHLIRAGKRTRCGMVVESGEPREVMHFCLLLGYGAGAVNPYLAMESIQHLAETDQLGGLGTEAAIDNYIKAAGKGILKVMSKMGISTLHSYRGAQIFEAIGLNQAFVDKYFTWTASRIEGIGAEEVAAETAARHHIAWEVPRVLNPELDAGGDYQWRRRGEYHMYNPETVGKMQHAVRSANYKLFKKYSQAVNDQSRNLCTIRGMLKLKKGNPIPLDEVEPAQEIVKRFKTGAMSFGSISKEAHENLAIAMNRIGARSNTGEGGEDQERFVRDDNGDLRRSSIKQVASGRFGVTSFYLVNSDELQIKMAQGAKPGEGGQLPGHKVDEVIARVRYSTPGVGLISPPPHHDIYSIEDLAQLIHDLKNSNDRARVSVKLVSEVGVGTIAAGVAKANADLVLISGDSGGTGASPLTSIKHAGAPWELGLAETQQTLVLNGLRSRIRVETDGQLKTGRDVAIAALLGAEEFGFGTSALVASGCILMRVCHLNTCPVGVATQDPELRKRFKGQPEHVINMMMFVAEELREIMAELGFRSMDEMVGRADMLETDEAIAHWKGKGLDLTPILHVPEVPEGTPLHATEEQDHGLDKALDNKLIELSKDALEQRIPVDIEMPIQNINRTVCTMLSAEVSRRHGLKGLPPETINLKFHGSAGQSFGAFLADGLNVRLEGDANDYCGKGMSGGRIVVVPPKGSTFVPEDNIITGNVALYGATGGELFLRGRAGERFAVRNSGATTVVEGVGDHGCEYMTRGTVVVLGTTGRNFAAGMSGGVAYVLDIEGDFEEYCNKGMVELEPLDEEGEKIVRLLVNRHHEHTQSEVAWRVLSAWPQWKDKFVRIMPTEYKRVLTEQKKDTEWSRLAAV